MRNIPNIIGKIETYILCSISENHVVCEIMWKNTVQSVSQTDHR